MADNFTVEIKGKDRLLAQLNKGINFLERYVAEALDEIAGNIITDAKSYVAVDTGSLQKSIRKQVYAKPAHNVRKIGVRAGGYVRNPKTGRLVDYAVYQEYGTSRMRPQPFMRPAIHKNLLDMRMIMSKHLMKWL